MIKGIRKLSLMAVLAFVAALSAEATEPQRCKLYLQKSWVDNVAITDQYLVKLESSADYSLPTADVTVGTTVKLEANVLTGHEIVGWSYGPSDDITVVNTGHYASYTETNERTFQVSAQSDLYVGVHEAWLKYDITFNGNGGSGTMSGFSDRVYNVSYKLPSVGYGRTGYNFQGWSRDAKATTPEFADGASVSGESFGLDDRNKHVTLYAVWKAKSVTLTFDPQGGTVTSATKSVTYDQALGSLPTPTKTGNTFRGWYTSKTGGTQVTEATVSKYTSAATVYAQWTVDNYTITVKTAGEGSGTVSPSGSTSYAYGTTLTLTATAGTGSTFTQWDDGVMTAERTVTVGATNKTYTAQFDLQTFTVTFDPGEGTVSPTSKIVTYGKAYGELPTPSWIGHTFSEWQTSGGSRVTADDTVRLNGNVRLTAKYTVNTHLVQVVRNTASEGSGSVSGGGRYDYGTTVTIQAHANDGSLFVQWNDGNKNASREITVTKDVTYSASFDLEQYAVKFMYYDGQGQQITDTQTVKYGKAATPPANSVVDQYPKHHFTGWGNNSYGTVRGNLEVQALYEWNGYNIRYNVNAPSGEGWGSMSVQTLKMDAPHSLSRNNFSRTGHTFLGWSRDKSATTPAYHDEESVDALTDVRDAIVDLYAVWQPNTYTITFNANGEDATVTPETKTVTYGQTYGDLPTPERPANSFRGWYTTRSGADKVEPTTTVTITANQTLYAQWTSLRKTITYNLDGGRNPDGAPTSYIEGEGVTLPIPTRTGYIFKGWYTDAALTSEVQTAIDSEAKGEKTFYARWRVKYTALRLNANGGELAAEDAVRILEYGKKYQDIPNIYPTHRDDFADLYLISLNDGVFTTDELGRGSTAFYTMKALDFLPPNATFTYKAMVRSAGTGSYSNWEDGDGQLGGEADGTGSFDVLPGQNLTIYSKGNVLTPEVALDGSLTAGRNGLSGFSFSVELSCGTNGVGVAALPTPTREGWAFAGWYTEAEGGTRITDITTVGADPVTTLYAHWRSTTYTVTFDPQRGTVDPTSKSVILDQSYGDLPEPTREGYDFVGWYTSSASGEKVEPTTVVTREYDHTLYAHWTPKTYAITYSVTNGVMRVAPATGTFDESVSFSWSPDEQDGYVFTFKEAVVYVGTDRTGEVLANMTSGNTGYFTMTKAYHAAVFVDVLFEKKGREYWVSFDGNGGTPSLGSIKVTYDGTYPDLPTASRDGSTFGGWWTDATAGTQVQKGDKVTITEDQRLYAHWTQDQYTIAYYGGASATGTMADQKANVNAEVQLQPNAFERTGYTFLGWATDSAAAESWKWAYADEAKLPARFAAKDAKVYLYATWTNNAYTVRFWPNGGNGTMSDQCLTYDDTKRALLTCLFTRTGFTFEGWSTDPTNEVTYVDKAEVANLAAEPDAILNLYAKWTPVTTVDSDLSRAAGCAITVAGERQAILLETSATSTCFPENDHVVIQPGDKGTGEMHAVIRGTGTLTFKYLVKIQYPIEGYAFMFACTAGTNEVRASTYEWKNDIAYVKTNAGEETVSWIMKGTLGLNAVQIKEVIWKPDAGQWGPDSIGLTFRMNDGMVAPADIVTNGTYTVGEPIGAVPVLAREGRTFTGWATSADAIVANVSAAWIVPNEDTQLYAVWDGQPDDHPIPTEADRPVIGAGFTFMTDARFDYVVWTTESLENGGVWTEGEPMTGDGTAFTLPVREDADGTEPQRFYKVEVRQRK